MKKFLLKILILLAVLSMLGQTNAMSQTKIRLATMDNFPPFTYRQQGKLTGVDVDVVNEAASRLGLQVEIVAYPWTRVIESVKKGEVDGGFAAFETEERKVFCLYTGVLHFEQYHLFVKKGNEFPFSQIKDLYGKTIGKDTGVFVSTEFKQAVEDKKIWVEEVNDMDLLNLKKLSLGRIDAMVGDFGVILYQAKTLSIGKEIVSLGPVQEKQAAYLILSKKSVLPNKAELQQKLKAAITKIWEDGTYQMIVDRHTLEE